MDKKVSAFTLIEAILYLALVVIVISATSALFGMIVQARTRNRTVSEVEQQGRQIIDTITQAIRNADDVADPLPGGAQSTLELVMYDIADDPTIFDLDNGIVRISEAGGAQIPLNSPQVTVTNLLFENDSRSSTPGLIRVEFTIEYSGDGSADVTYSQIFTSSASLR